MYDKEWVEKAKSSAPVGAYGKELALKFSTPPPEGRLVLYAAKLLILKIYKTQASYCRIPTWAELTGLWDHLSETVPSRYIDISRRRGT
jgi:hypothetical protein